MKSFGMWMVSAVLLLSMYPIAPVDAYGADCDETDYGYGWEEPECKFSCVSGDTLNVETDGDGFDGSSHYIEGDAWCGGEHAECVRWDSSWCSGTDDDGTNTDAIGECEGRGYSGDTDYITVEVACVAGQDTRNVAEIQSGLLEGAREILKDFATEESSPALLPAAVATSSLALLRFDGEAASGIVCNAVGPGLLQCVAVPVDLGLQAGEVRLSL